MSFKDARWSRGVTRVPRALPGGCSLAVRQVMDVFGTFRKSVFDPLASLEVVLGAPPSIIVSNLTPVVLGW